MYDSDHISSRDRVSKHLEMFVLVLASLNMNMVCSLAFVRSDVISRAIKCFVLVSQLAVRSYNTSKMQAYSIQYV